VWIDTLHRWFAHWLYGIDLGSLPKLRLRTKPGRRLVLTSPVAARVRISRPEKAVPLAAGTPRTVALHAKAGRVRLTLVTTAGALKRTDRVTVRLKRQPSSRPRPPRPPRPPAGQSG
jgi:hypothetical protein